ncbi:MAG TPA: hypothetical protein VFH03_08860 [Actinoplanes sp.]|nr:hypothetical protein [Actinoplanes sp.]
MHDSSPGGLAVGWRAPNARAGLRISFAAAAFRLSLRAGRDREEITDATLRTDARPTRR